MKGLFNLLATILLSLLMLFFYMHDGLSLTTLIITMVNIPLIALNLLAFIALATSKS